MYIGRLENAMAKKCPEEMAKLAIDDLVTLQKEIPRFIPTRMRNSSGRDILEPRFPSC
jgi:hypothetical protein